ncbi:MAG: IS3 family transposase [Actinomycetota bacterium]
MARRRGLAAPGASAGAGQADPGPVRQTRGTYGSPLITADLREAGWRVSEKTTASIMAELGLVPARTPTAGLTGSPGGGTPGRRTPRPRPGRC